MQISVGNEFSELVVRTTPLDPTAQHFHLFSSHVDQSGEKLKLIFSEQVANGAGAGKLGMGIKLIWKRRDHAGEGSQRLKHLQRRTIDTPQRLHRNDPPFSPSTSRRGGQRRGNTLESTLYN